MSMKKNNILLKDCCEIKAGGDKPKNFSKSKTDICTIPVYANGIDNIHVYCMNKPDVAEKIKSNISEILK